MDNFNEKIVIVDDMLINANIIKEQLEMNGFTQIEIFDDSVMAAKKILQMDNQPIIITDYSMPLKNGEQLIAEVKTHFPGIKAVIITSLKDESIISEIPYKVLDKNAECLLKELITWLHDGSNQN